MNESATDSIELEPEHIKPLRIAFVMASEEHGGAAIMTFRQAKGLAKLGHEVRLYCAGPVASERKEDGIYIEVIEQRNPLMLYHYANPSLIFRLWLRLRKFNPDVLHFVAINLRTFSLAALELSHLYPTVWTLKDVWPVCMTGWPEPPDCDGMIDGCISCQSWPLWQTHLNRVLKESVYATSHLHIAVPSKWLADLIKKSSCLGRKPITIIPNGLDPEPWSFGALRTYKRKQFNKNKPFKILYPAGRLLAGKSPAIRKGWPDLLEAIRIMVDQGLPVEVLFVGDIDYAQKKEAENLPIQWFPACHYEQIQTLYKKAGIFVLPTVGDNFPATVLEAMAAGLPVVATNTGGIPEAVIDGETGILIPSHSPLELAQSIQKLMQNDELRKKMGRAGRARFERLFTADRMVALYNSLFKKVANI
jgi:glycosyltransferase involved in cell wall biosynthesis